MEKVSEIQKINMKFDFDLLLGNAEMRGDPDNTGIWCCVKTETSTPVTECGDGTCEGEENCTNCPADCKCASDSDCNAGEKCKDGVCVAEQTQPP